MNIGSDKHGPRLDTSPRIDGKHVSYNLDGSGRDTYIENSNGGFYPGKTIADY